MPSAHLSAILLFWAQIFGGIAAFIFVFREVREKWKQLRERNVPLTITRFRLLLILGLIALSVLSGIVGLWVVHTSKPPSQKPCPQPAVAQTIPPPQQPLIPHAPQPSRLTKRAAPVKTASEPGTVTQSGTDNQQTVTQAPIEQNNSGGCNQQIVGGNGNTNNCIPPERILSKEQIGALSAAVKQVPSNVQVKIGAMDNGEAYRYADQIRQALGIERKVGTFMSSHTKGGIFVTVTSPDDVAFLPAENLAKTMRQAGLPIVDVEQDPVHNHPGEIGLVIGEQ